VKTALLLLVLFCAGLGRLEAQSPEDLERTARARYIERDFKTAISLFEQCVQAAPLGELREKALNGLGEALWASGNVDEAIRQFTNAVDTGSSDTQRPLAFYHLTMAYVAKDDTTAGLAMAYRLAAEYPKSGWAPHALGMMARLAASKESNPGKAIPINEMIALKFPDSVQAKDALAELPELRKSLARQLQKDAKSARQK
jgi:TolA-binding protein